MGHLPPSPAMANTTSRLWGAPQSRALTHLTDALLFACTHIPRLEQYSQYWDDHDDPYVSPADKVVVETALLALVASRVPSPSPRLRAILDDLARHLVPRVRSERNQVLLMRFPHTAASLGLAHVILTKLGYPDVGFDQLFHRALNSESISAIERLPYRSMDLRWLRGIAYPSQPVDVNDLLPHSILTSEAHPIYMSPADTYVLTHSLMYATDFGQHPLSPAVDLARVRDMVEAGIAYHLLSENLDLLGELLLGSAILGDMETPAFALGWWAVTDVWSDPGFLPSPTFDRSAFAVLEGVAASAYAFRHIYHTTYVGGILCAVMLTRQRRDDDVHAPPARPGIDAELVGRCRRAVADALAFCESHPAMATDPDTEMGSGSAQATERDGNRAISPLDIVRQHIRAYDGACSRPEAMWARIAATGIVDDDALASLLSDALLTQAARDYQLAALARVMTDTVRLELPVSATLIQATKFLLCQQVPSGAIGAHFVMPDNQTASAAPTVTLGLAQSLAAVAMRLDGDAAGASSRGFPTPGGV